MSHTLFICDIILPNELLDKILKYTNNADLIMPFHNIMSKDTINYLLKLI